VLDKRDVDSRSIDNVVVDLARFDAPLVYLDEAFRGARVALCPLSP